MTETIGWGDVEREPRRLPLVGHSRRRRIVAGAVVAVLVGGVLAWPSFASWRADGAARSLQQAWAVATGYGDARLAALAEVQSHLGAMDGPAYMDAISRIDRQEGNALRKLSRELQRLRTWTGEVSSARNAVVRGIAANDAGLRREMADPHAGDFLASITVPWNPSENVVIDRAQRAIDALAQHHHLRPARPVVARFDATDAIAQRLRRPTDTPLHLRLVSSAASAVTVTDLDSGRVTLTRDVPISRDGFWAPARMLGHALVGQDNRRIVIVPLSSARVHVVRGDSVISSSGSPMWVYDLNGTLSAYDEGGHRVSGPVPVGHQALAGNGDAEKVLVDDSTQEPGMGRPSTYHLFAPATGRTTLLPTKGCAQVPAIGGGVVVVPTGDQCEVTRTLDVFRLDGSLLRMARIPGTESLGAPPLPSPDGRYVALRLNNPDDVISDLGNLAILDMASGRWTVIRDTSTWDTAGWSSDGSVLLMHNQDVGAATTFSTLAYLRPGESRLRSLRVAAGEANFLVPN